MFWAKGVLLAGLALIACGCASAPQPESSAMRFIEAEGVKVHVETWGEGEPVLLIHGASSDMDVFQPSVIPTLKGRYLLAAYDRPGMGFTAQRPPRSDTLAVQAKVAADVIEGLHLKAPVIVVAHSWGGAVALRLALDRPDLVRGLVLIAPVAYDWPGGVSWYLYWSANPVVGPLFNNVLAPPFTAGAARQGMVAAFAPATPPPGYFETAQVIRAVAPGALRANGLDLLAAKREVNAQEGRYSEIKAPVAIFVGEGDSVVSPSIHAEQLARNLPDARLVVLKGAGHLPHEAEPQTLAALVDWVRERPR